MSSQTDTVIAIPDSLDVVSLVGVSDCVLKAVRDSFSARITLKDNRIEVSGDSVEVSSIVSVFAELFRMLETEASLSPDHAYRAIDMARAGQYAPGALRDDVLLTYRGRPIRPKTIGQKHYVDSIRKHTITFGIGPAGTGKTYLAMAMAIASLKRKEIDRIILTRPVVEAGESLGYLPGTLAEKVDPYIRPLQDALFDMVDAQHAGHLIETGVVEIAPLAYMRGRTLNSSFVILDEAQNTTPDQMKMFLTRLGFGSKMVITGDVTQLDLPRGVSGLKTVRSVLSGIDDIAFCDLSSHDVVRHSLVARIVDAYEKAESSK